MKTRCLVWIGVCIALTVVSCSQPQERGPADKSEAAQPNLDDDEHPIALKDVPAVVMSAARGAVAQFEAQSAATENEDGTTVYILFGLAAGVAYEVEVSADGKVREIESGDDDDGEDEDEDERDDD